jgi:hypothetical protein
MPAENNVYNFGSNTLKVKDSYYAGNIYLDTSSTTTGNIYKNGSLFMHTFKHPTGLSAKPDGYNLFVGVNSGNQTMGSTATSTDHASYNTSLGDNSLCSNTTGYYNSNVGASGLRSNTTGSCNSNVGTSGLYSNTTGNNNSNVGVSGLLYNTTGGYNNNMGVNGLRYNTTGYYNNNMGTYGLYSNTTGSYNSNVGASGLYSNTTGNNNSNMGMSGLYSNTTGSYNSNVGASGLYSNTTGIYNSNMGTYGLFYNTTGSYNNNMGTYGLCYNTTGGYNNNVGVNGLHYNTTGSYNSNVGLSGLYYISNSSQNSSFGAESFNTFNENTSGNKNFDNTDITVSTDKIKITAHSFGSVGLYVLLKYTQGTSAITGLSNGVVYRFLIAHEDTIQCMTDITDAGSGTGHTFTPQYEYSNSTALGYDAEPTASNQVVLGNTSVTTVKTSGNYQQKVWTNNVSNPPTDAELDAIWTSPAEVGTGWTAYLNDNGDGLDFYTIVSDGTNWWVFTGVKAL